MIAQQGYGAYANNKIMTASPAELTLMLYEGAIKFCNIALIGIEQNDIEKSHNNIIKVEKIIDEFRATLNPKYEVSKDFDNVYAYLKQRLIEANMKKDPEILEEVLKHLRTMRDTWKEVMTLSAQEREKERKTLGPELIFRPESEGVMTHLGSFASFVGGLRAAENAAAGEKLATMVQTAAVVFSCLIALGLTASGGLISLALPAVLLYQAAWTVLQLAMPLSKQ